MKKILFLCLACLFVLSAEASGDGKGWGMRPATEGVVYFDLHLQPGDEFVSALNFINSDDEPITLNVEFVDSINIQGGGFGLAEGPGLVTDWLEFDPQFVTIDSQDSKVLPFALRIPASAQPGDYGGGFVAFTPDDSSSTSESPGMRIVIIERIGIALIVRVGDPNHCEIEIIGAEASLARDGGALIILEMNNSGNVAFEGQGEVSVGEWSQSLQIGYSLPGRISYPISAPLEAGSHQLEAVVQSDDFESCSDTLTASIALVSEPTPEPKSLLAEILEDGKKMAEELAGQVLPREEIRSIVRVFLAICLIAGALIFGWVYFRWLVRYARRN